MDYKKFILLCALLFSSCVSAKTVSGVDVAETITLTNQTLKLNGAGVRTKFFLDLYVGSLYLLKKTNNVYDILDAPIAVIRLNITSSLITKSRMRDAINEGFDNATADNTANIKKQINSFMSLFSDKITSGDQFTFKMIKGHGVNTYKNGTFKSTIKGEAFRKALLKIWLGIKPAQTSLKKAMLGD